LRSHGAGGSLQAFHIRLGIWITWVDKESDQIGRGQQVVQHLQLLRLERVADGRNSGKVAAGSVEAGDETKLDRVAAGGEDDRDCLGRRLGRECRSNTIGVDRGQWS
jgi:hypothetical protein